MSGNGHGLQLCDSESKDIEKTEAFAFEVAFRLKAKKGELVHFHPFIEEGVTNVRQNNFDGKIRLTSVVKNMHPAVISSDGNWQSSIHKIEGQEFETVLDLQIQKYYSCQNDRVIFKENQYGQALPFFRFHQHIRKKTGIRYK